MTVLQWNIRGLAANTAELSLLLGQFGPSVVCLQETKLAENSKYSPPKNYKAYNKIHTDNLIASGGSTILVKNCTLQRAIPLHTQLQAIAVRVTLHRAITICSVYVPPDRHLSLRELDDLRDQLPKPFIIMGDLNGHSSLWDRHWPDTPDQHGKVVEDFLAQTNTALLNTGSPTYRNAHYLTTSAIDLTMCSPDLAASFRWSALDDTHGSDHMPTILTPDTPAAATQPQFFNFLKANWPAFERECSQLSQDTITDMACFSKAVLDIAEKHIPLLSSRARKNKVWFNEDCARAVLKKKEALRKCIETKNNTDIALFKIARADCRRVIREAKRNSFRRLVSKVNHKTPLRKVFNIVKKLRGTHVDTIQHIVGANGKTAETEKDVANSIAASFSKNSHPSSHSDAFIRHRQASERNKINFASDNSEAYNANFSLEELKTSIEELSDTASGPDKVHNNLIKHFPGETLQLLLKLYNDIWTSGNFPDLWHLATVIPLPKPGKDHTDPSNYRPIALTSCLCKLMEKLVNKRLMWVLENGNLLSSLQCGFRKNRSTMDHLVRLETFIREAFIRGEHIVAVFFDLEKAFDTTWKYGILRDLHKMGLRGYLPQFIENFLKNRSFQVKVGSHLSDPLTQEEGVPQGSVLSPLLFEIKMDSIVSELSNGIDGSLFVDDFSILYKSRAPIDTIERQLQLQLNKLELWANKNGFKFSTSKTEAVHFCRKRKCTRQPDLRLCKERLPVSKEYKYLGVIFDHKLSFLPHLKNLKKRCQLALNALKILSNPEWGGDTETLLHLYRSIVRSKLDYASPIYGSARASYLKILDPIQNEGLRIAMGAYRTSPAESLCAEANEPPLELRRKKLSLQYALKLSSTPDNPAFDAVFRTPRVIKTAVAKNENHIKPFGLRVREDFGEMMWEKEDTEDFFFPPTPPWQLQVPEINTSLAGTAKGETNAETYKKAFKDLLGKYQGFEQIYTDGSKSETAVGAAAVHPTAQAKKQQKLNADASIYTAEASAIDMALDIVKKSSKKSFLILTDSLSCLKALQHSDNSDTRILKLRLKIDSLLTKKQITLAWLPSHIGIDGNELADTAAKEALELEEIKIKRLHYTDYRKKVREHVHSLWEERWAAQVGNKLHELKPKLQPRKPSLLPRKDCVKFTRLKIGHTSLTHRFLLAGEESPECVSCNCKLTIRHLLLECIEFSNMRQKYYRYNNLKHLFDCTQPKKILDFLREVGLYNKL